MTLGQRLKQAREYVGMSQLALSRKSGVTQQMISKLESGRAEKTADVFSLAATLNVSPAWLDHGEGDMIQTPISSIQYVYDNAPPEVRHLLDVALQFKDCPPSEAERSARVLEALLIK